MTRGSGAALVVALVCLVEAGRAATGLPTGLQDSTFVSGLSNPTAMQFAPDGRLFVAQQGGQLRVVKNGSLLTTPFLTVTVSSSGERGLLGVAFDPNFATNQFLYVFYTATSPAVHNRISRFTANGDVVQAGSELVILDFDNLSGATNHNGGAIHFGLDGKLYAAHGDNATGSNAQTLNNLLGKIIRMNPVADAVAQVPTDNPFYSTASGKNRLIWTLGLRNPFTFSIQPVTGLTYVNDVGQNNWEEINDARSGRNLGWPTTEGMFNPSTYPQFTNPVYSYAHSGTAPTGCAITGGVFYNPSAPTFPSVYIGKYFFADYCSGWIFYIDPASPGTATPFAAAISSPVDLKVGPDAALYYLARGAGSIGRIAPSAGALPQLTQHPANVTVGAGSAATFTISATGTPPLSYQWQKNGSDIPGATSASYTTPAASPADSGSAYRCRVSNSAGTAFSNAATLTVAAGTPPTGTIAMPTAGSRYSGGTTLTFSGTGTDAEDGALPATAFRWRIDFHHDTHTHPALANTTGVRSGTFAIPNSGETSANVWYRVYLTVTDASGLSSTTFVDVQPNTVLLTIRTMPPGLQVTLDGQPAVTPITVSSVVGILRTLGALSPQSVPPSVYHFESWSDGGAASHTVTTPSTSGTYVVAYQTNPRPPTNLRIQQ